MRLLRDLKMALVIAGWCWLVLGVLYAYAVGISRWDDEEPMHSGARPDSRHYVAVDPSSPEVVTPSGYAVAPALRSFGQAE